VSEQHLTLTEDLHAPAHARAWVATRLPPVAHDVTEDVLLLVSELVTNAVRHGRPDIVVGLSVRRGLVRVEVRDGGDALPVVPAGQPSVERVTGRGLLIVSMTAQDWGIDRVAGRPGKTVWAELATSPPESEIRTHRAADARQAKFS
jgi:anti-sigma regulatory factor (Ser/Thr protein kinase)